MIESDLAGCYMYPLYMVGCLLDGDHVAFFPVLLRHQPHHLLHVLLPLEGLHVDHQHGLLDVVVHLLVQGVHPPVQDHAQSATKHVLILNAIKT